MARYCEPLAVDCSVCGVHSSTPCPTSINVPAGLTPTDQVYVWLRDRFSSIYYDLITVNADGSFDIIPSNFRDGIFTIGNIAFDLFVTSDIDGINILPLTINNISYNCLILSIQ